MAPRRALICGVSGQDGAFLAQLLLEKGYAVVGTSRDAQLSELRNLNALGLVDRVKVESMAVNDFRSVLQCIAKTEPDEIYNLAGQSSVGLSFAQPMETLESIAYANLNLLEAVRFIGRPIRFYNAGSSECFGDTGDAAANETTAFAPRSPYAVAKATAHWAVANYREAYGLFACSGILFNHESPLRPARFVTRKIVQAACRISRGSKERLSLGATTIVRDWGWAPEYVLAMWKMLQQPVARDYVIATGESHALSKLVDLAFAHVGLDARDHVMSDPTLLRPSEIMIGRADPSRAARELEWRAEVRFAEVVRRMMDAELAAMAH